MATTLNPGCYNFLKPEEFFEEIDSGGFNPVTEATYEASDNPDTSPFKTGVIIRVNGKFLLIQFVRPRVWKIKFAPKVEAASGYNDYNSRTIIKDTIANLKAYLDDIEHIFWETQFETGDPQAAYYILKTIKYDNADDLENHVNGTVETELRIYKSPFKLQAIRSVQESGYLNADKLDSPVTSKKIVWQANGLGWKPCSTTVDAIVLTTRKPGSSRYLGFGEQGGKTLLKGPTLMNYFDFDNMTYSSVYNQGPLDEREPLYHSEPWWLEVNALPSYKSQVATFIDNYSQVCVDFQKTNAGNIRVGTRFGMMQAYFIAGDDVPDIISVYSSIVGRARLKPRFVLGHHQGCYGYDNERKVLGVAQMYSQRDFPLDGIHIDVDMQRGYRTFTIDSERKFPNPKQMFEELRVLGVKACTNITPVINCLKDDNYDTLNTGLAGNHFIVDERFKADGGNPTPVHQVEYVCYENGVKLWIDPVNEMGGFETTDSDYDFVKNYNSGKPYRGGVGYGGTLGAPGFYPDLNAPATRKWWGEQYKYLMETGLEFVWQDMTTPAIAKEYGDMKGLPFQLLVSSDPWDGEVPGPEQNPKKPALELWALYPYNLHKATYEGLNKLDARKGKRNLIIGRGAYTGMHKYAGFWTGDNASNWDHLRISVAQVLAMGLSGMEVAGADVGGFMPAAGFGDTGPPHAAPELVIRWYCAYSLLPWFRNHYHGKRGMKLFQEPWAFTDFYNANPSGVAEAERLTWLSVEPVCRYFIKLRYSLMQLMYDAMFEHQFNGLPIARALIITDTEDTSLFGENDWVLDNEYIVRQDLLVAPLISNDSSSGANREIYLPTTSSWYQFNLRITPASYGVPLAQKIPGGSRFVADCHISNNDAWIPHITPIYIREGGIIPQIEPRQYVGDKEPNPVTINVYPGKNNTYGLYLDDGVSRESAPIRGKPDVDDVDPEAADKYNLVEFKQETDSNGSRKVSITTKRDGYGNANVEKDIGSKYTVVFWHDPGTTVTEDSPTATFTGTQGEQWKNYVDLKATVATVPVNIAKDATVTITVASA